MAEYALPLDRYSAQTHIEALQGLVDRYEHEQEPIHYKKAASGVNISETTCSSCLKYLNDIGLITAEKQGVYIPSDPVANFLTKVGTAREEAINNIVSNLTNNPIFDETVFHLDEDGVELNDLSTRVAGGLGINKDEISKIKKAIEIFAEFEALNIDEGGVVAPHENSEINSKNKASEKEQLDGEEQILSSDGSWNQNPEQVDPGELELPPTKGDPERLHTLCTHLRKGGKWSISEIASESEFAKRTAQGHVRYGEELEFIERTEGDISPKERGYELGFKSELNEETHELFLEGILESDFYSVLLFRCIESIVEETDEGPVITSSGAVKELRTYFGFTEEKEGTLRDVLTTFFKTVEASGFGNYVVGRGGRETRLEISAGELEELVQTFRGREYENRSDAEVSKNEGDGEWEEEEEEEDITNEPNDEGGQEIQGPPLRISSFRIQNFRNIQDTGVVRLENITTFIGKNESGKTSTLEAIDSFDNDYFYLPRDICNDIGVDYDLTQEGGKDIPILTLTFEITPEVLETFYPNYEFEGDLPIKYEMTKFADGHIEDDSELEISPPSPDIVYYNEYDIISDSLYFDEEEENQNKTFKNLLNVGDLKETDIVNSSGLEHHQAIENAENLIESRLNEAWSQKDIRINLRYNESEDCLHLFIQDDLEERERTLTQPSQRSEGFQWFFSFYVNLLAETSTKGEGYKILLLDDPAVHLHPSGKQDWLDSLEEVAKEEQVLYTSHSPYLINKQYPSRIRTVQDTSEGTQISADIFDADTGTLEPLRNALGIDLGSSPFISEGQILVEGPSEYYILTAVGEYFENSLQREFIDWNKVSIMPVRGANDTIGKASWLASENIEFSILLDSDEEGQDVQDRISNHHQDIDDERVLLLERRPHDEDVVLEDLFSPEFYVEAFNEYYRKFTESFDQDFEPITVQADGHNSWEVGVTEYEGSRIDQVLVTELERQDVADELRNDEGEIEIHKRQIAEIISDKINIGEVEEDDLEFFNPVLARIESSMQL